MDVDCILNASKASAFLDGEIGEVDARVVLGKSGPRIALAAYKCKKLSEAEERVLLGLRSYLKDALEKAKYTVSRRADGND